MDAVKCWWCESEVKSDDEDAFVLTVEDEDGDDVSRLFCSTDCMIAAL